MNHNGSVKAMGFRKYIGKCSCGYVSSPVATKLKAATAVRGHVAAQLRRAKAQAAFAPAGVVAMSPQDSSSVDMHSLVKELSQLAETYRERGQQEMADAENKLTDEDLALSTVEYEYYIKMAGSGLSLQDAGNAIETILRQHVPNQDD